MTRILDVTVPLSAEVLVYPGDPAFSLEPTHEIAKGAPYNLGRLSLGTQTGTHVDAPYHFLADGATVDQLPLEILLGKARVVELMARERVDRSDLEALDLRDDLRLLFKTRMSGQMLRPQFQDEHVYFTEDAATYLVQAGIKLVGHRLPLVREAGQPRVPGPPRPAPGGGGDRRGARPVGGGARRVRPRLPAPARGGGRRCARPGPPPQPRLIRPGMTHPRRPIMVARPVRP